MWLAREENGQLFLYDKEPHLNDVGSYLSVNCDIIGNIWHENKLTKSVTYKGGPVKVKFVKV